jgi:hypothetical protein
MNTAIFMTIPSGLFGSGGGGGIHSGGPVEETQAASDAIFNRSLVFSTPIGEQEISLRVDRSMFLLRVQITRGEEPVDFAVWIESFRILAGGVPMAMVTAMSWADR